MTALTITAKRQVTLKKNILEHLRVSPGDQISVEKLPNGRIELRAAPSGEISAVFGLLKRRGGSKLSVEQINVISRKGWSGSKK